MEVLFALFLQENDYSNYTTILIIDTFIFISVARIIDTMWQYWSSSKKDLANFQKKVGKQLPKDLMLCSKNLKVFLLLFSFTHQQNSVATLIIAPHCVTTPIN